MTCTVEVRPNIFLLYIVLVYLLAQAGSTETQRSQEDWAREEENVNTLPTTERPDTTQDGRLGFESIEDLEHLSYLSLRNFNMTDESLLQSSLILGLGNALGRKQHQKEGGSVGETEGMASEGGDSKERLSSMLESFILRLRNGRLRRLTLEELESMAGSLDSASGLVDHQRSIEGPNKVPSEESEQIKDEASSFESAKRCAYLVSIYESDLRDRASRGRVNEASSTPEVPNAAAGSGIERENENQTEGFGKNRSSVVQIDRARLLRLCRLVIRCQTADELISLIDADGSWTPKLTNAGEETKDGAEWSSRKTRSLRDSLSASLAKLCPLILFQLHDDEGMCSIRRDDRPPTLTVWGFATLFVTIVSFCSLIGLSITPLLGPAGADSSGTSDETSATERTGNRSSRLPAEWPSAGKAQHHRSCLTLFEGLAVGSLVGSALFSLIPQAFELQEHESNQGFLLKALIIFLGIYLFFCSERIMRIILDTRRMRKKKKHLLNHHRGSNSIQPPSTTFDYDQQHQQHPLDIHTRLQQRFNLPDQHQQNEHQQQSRRPGQLEQSLPSNSSGRGKRAFRERKVGSDQPVTARWSSATESGKFCQLSGATHQRSANQHIEISGRAVSASGDKSQNRGVNFKAEPDPNKSKIGRRQERVKRKSQRKPRTADALEEVDGSKLVMGDDQVEVAPGKTANTRQHQQQIKTLSSAKSNRRKRLRRTRQQQLLAVSRRIGRRQAQQHQLKAVMQRDVGTILSTGTNLSEGTGGGGRRRTQLSSSSSSMLNLHSDERSLNFNDSKRSRGEWKLGSFQDFASLSSDMVDELYDDQNQSTGSLSSDDLSDNELHQRQQRAVSVQLTSNRCADQSRSSQQAVGLGVESKELLSSKSTRRRDLNGNLHHQHKHKREISTVAWMIVLGDGLHNFIDGISIGAAFSESILSGVSISVAVICEEFPHELGDFAVLVSSGMTVRQALGYNFLSACTCYLGMAIGIILGDVNDGASYISALAAGVFLYIALVDMMGELSAALEETSRDSITKTLKLLLLQNVGIFIGISIIFVLSFIDF